MKDNDKLIRVGFDIPGILHKRLKMHALKKDKTLRSILNDMIEKEVGGEEKDKKYIPPPERWIPA